MLDALLNNEFILLNQRFRCGSWYRILYNMLYLLLKDFLGIVHVLDVEELLVEGKTFRLL
jgi:hypothetical protein